MIQGVNTYVRREYHAIHEFLWQSGYLSMTHSMPKRWDGAMLWTRRNSAWDNNCICTRAALESRMYIDHAGLEGARWKCEIITCTSMVLATVWVKLLRYHGFSQNLTHVPGFFLTVCSNSIRPHVGRVSEQKFALVSTEKTSHPRPPTAVASMAHWQWTRWQETSMSQLESECQKWKAFVLGKQLMVV